MPEVRHNHVKSDFFWPETSLLSETLCTTKPGNKHWHFFLRNLIMSNIVIKYSTIWVSSSDTGASLKPYWYRLQPTFWKVILLFLAHEYCFNVWFVIFSVYCVKPWSFLFKRGWMTGKRLLYKWTKIMQKVSKCKSCFITKICWFKICAKSFKKACLHVTL